VRRRTLAAPVTVRGIGIHRGEAAAATLVPAETPGAGVVFRVRRPGTPAQEIAATALNVEGTTRCTVLRAGAVSVGTVEHLLSALAGSGVTDCVIEVDGPELPIGDGSALLWTNALVGAGLRDLDEAVVPIRLREPLLLAGKGGAFLVAHPSATPRYTVAIQFEHPLVGTQVTRWEPTEPGQEYAAEVAPARTFGFIEEVEALRAAGLARGGSEDNAVVVFADRFSRPLRFPDELARHKLLDLIGDLALAGRPLAADVIAYRPSHALNTEFARRLQDAAAAGGGSDPGEFSS
jgi:UDP-3-O-[3-hydroxymyristoyl] N-acetylglucosamine deacetylase